MSNFRYVFTSKLIEIILGRIFLFFFCEDSINEWRISSYSSRPNLNSKISIEGLLNDRMSQPRDSYRKVDTY